MIRLCPFSTTPIQPFVIQLVCNLLDEGNSCFRDGDCRQASQQYGEGISVARYAQAEALVIPHELLESLYVNRAAACYQTVREKTEGMLVCVTRVTVSLRFDPHNARISNPGYASVNVAAFMAIIKMSFYSMGFFCNNQI